ncbi:MAG: DUF3347 domain-containing protein [Taibaiella sp.]|jgi:hypothetical protein
MKLIFIALSAIAVLSFASCSNPTNKQENTSNVETNNNAPSEELVDAKIVKPSFAIADSKLKTQMQHIYNAYLLMQTALVNNKTAEAATQAKSVSQFISSFGTTDLPTDQKQAYEAHVVKIQELATSIANTQDIKSQRTSFSPLSNQIYELVIAFGNDQPVYQAHCPMAFDGKGASWLSDKTEIRNPYYGDEMLECGEVINIVKK